MMDRSVSYIFGHLMFHRIATADNPLVRNMDQNLCHAYPFLISN